MSQPGSDSSAKRVLRHVRARFVSGLLVLVPLAVTLFVVKVIFSSLASFARPLVHPWIGELPEFALTLLALLATLLLIYGAGVAATLIVGRRLIRFGEALFLRLPLVKRVYATTKQVLNTVSASAKTSFRAVAVVEFPRKGALTLGFVTGATRSDDGRTRYNVFVGTTPNPTTGYLVILPEEQVQFTDISVEDGIKMIVSGGVLAPASYNLRPRPETLAPPPVQQAAP